MTQGVGIRRWRTVDTGTTRTFLQVAAPRVRCPEHGVLVAHVPWARPGAKCTYLLEDTCAWLVKNMALSAVAVFLQLSWRSASGIVARVVAELTGKVDQLDGLRRIGIDEIAYRQGHRYLTCVVDHDTGRLVWAHEGRNKDTLRVFFRDLGESRSAVLTHVSADGAEWIHAVVREHTPQAVLCLDPYHVVAWVTKALDRVRRRTLEAAVGRDRDARWAVIKNPGDLTDGQQLSLARIKRTNTALYRAYLLKEQLRAVFAVKGQRGKELLAGWISWARRSRLPEFVTLARTIQRFHQLIWNTLQHNLSNALSEATNTQYPGADQTRLRLPLTRGADRDGHADPRRPGPGPARPESLNRNRFPTTGPAEPAEPEQPNHSSSRPVRRRKPRRRGRGRACRAPVTSVRGVGRAAQVTGPPLQPQGSLRDRCATACGRP
jgi:transposase